ncbi:DNA polymerase III subunit alpha [Rathayibacter rathayi]|uniref:DNA polymerase III subunit alpha n=1 Tax=Rathayibacter rathayi TaxID=33887 RepID=UPI000CE783F1|nr:DNA polymerase III subunit alpha [Rathayibacter rathayi]PPG14389.1 hypothetical protein C5C11_04960 [Rathayibacter rathayi]
MTDAASPSRYVSLHTHSEHSELDSLAKISDLFARTAELGQPALAITDHGTLGGLWKAQNAADLHGVKLIPGIEAYLAIGDRFQHNQVELADGELADDSDDSAADDEAGGHDENGEPKPAKARTKTKKYEHLTLLAVSETGWRNLVRINNAAQKTKWGKYARIDYALVKQHAEGVVILSGCLGGPILGPLSRGDYSQAEANLLKMIATVGRENVYIEVMEHGIESESAILHLAAQLAQEHGIPLVATNDSHHTHAHDADAHDAWLAVSTKALVSDQKRYRFSGTGYHHRSEEEMLDLRPEAWWAEAIANTMLVADRVEGRILPPPTPKLPAFPTPDGFSDNLRYYHHLVTQGAIARYGDLTLRPDVRARLNEELAIIRDAGFIDYFLIVQDVVAWARANSILVGPGRGSGAGSITAYCLGITGLCPLENSLLFERFLEPGRPDFPDFDVDFEALRRADILDYLQRKWGPKSVALIGAFGSAKTKQALKSAARVLEAGSVGDKLAKVVPIAGGNPFTFAQLEDLTLGEADPFRDQLAKLGEKGEDVVALARQFAGTVSGVSIHACGVIVSDLDLTDLIPLRIDSKTGRWVSQWDSKDVEAFGLLKLDILSLRNLDIAHQAITFIYEQTGEQLDFDRIPHPNTQGDPRVDAAFRTIREGRTAGLFQLESPKMTELAQDVGPTNLRDLSALVALFRPGPLSAGMDQHYARRKNGRDAVDYSIFTDDPREQDVIASVLGDTFGTCLAGDAQVYSQTRGRLVPIWDIRVGERVQGICDDLNPASGVVTAWTQTGIRPTVRTSLSDGSTLRSTNDHRVMTPTGWVAVGSLHPGDVIAAPWTYLAPDTVRPATPTDLARARVLGFLLGDGSLGASCAVVFSGKERELHEALRDAVSVAFPDSSFSESIGLRDILRTKVAGPRGRGSGTLLEWLRVLGLEGSARSTTNGGLRSADLFVPHRFLSADSDVIRALLAALWDTDGYVSGSTACSPIASFTTMSPQLAEDVRFLLRRVGITSSVTRSSHLSTKGVRTAYQVTVTSVRIFASEIAPWLSHAGKRAAAATMVRSSDLLHARTTRRESAHPKTLVRSLVQASGVPVRLAFRKHDTSRSFVNSGRVGESTVNRIAYAVGSAEMDPLTRVQWLAIKSQTSGPVEPVYDITVDGIHNFIADGVVVHNCIFQEQLMSLGRVMAGFDVDARGLLRRAVGKKDKVKMAEVGQMFIAGCVQDFRDPITGEITSPAMSERTALVMWEAMKGSGEYLFNASHSAAYAQLAYITAYLKANWPAAYGAAILAVTEKPEKRQQALRSLPEEGIEVLAPDVNRSGAHSRPEGPTSVRLGLKEIKGVGDSGERIARVREESGKLFTSLTDVANRVRQGGSAADGSDSLKYLPTNHLEGLVEAGALDEFGPRMGQHAAARIAKTGNDVVPPPIEWGYLERSARQRQRLLVSLGTHPLIQLHDEVSAWRHHREAGGRSFHMRASAVEEVPNEDGASVTVLGLLGRYAEKPYRGGQMAGLTIEGPRASVEAVMWNDTVEATKMAGTMPNIGGVLAVSARVKIRVFESEDDEGNIVETTEHQLQVNQVYPVPVHDPVQGNLPPTDIPRIAFATAPRPQASRKTAAKAPAPVPAQAEPAPEPSPVRVVDSGLRVLVARPYDGSTDIVRRNGLMPTSKLAQRVLAFTGTQPTLNTWPSEHGASFAVIDTDLITTLAVIEVAAETG